MGSRYRKQESTRLMLEGGDWLLVRKHLTAGEARHADAKLFRAHTVKGGEKPEIDLEQIGVTEAVAYLLDWSITDADDHPIVIRDQSPDFIESALLAQTPESLNEIIAAIKRHDVAMIAERAQEKKVPAGEPAPDPTSTSVA
jgi:hypothetical protein